MRDEPHSSGAGFTFIFRVCGVVAMLAIAFIFLRMLLPMFAKIALLCVAPFAVWWLFAIPGRIEEVKAIISQYRKIKSSKVRNRHRVMLID